VEEKKMDFNKRVEVYYRNCKVEAEEGHQALCEGYNDDDLFLIKFVKNDCPAETHNESIDTLLAKFGVHSDFAKEQGNYIMPYLINIETGLMTFPKELVKSYETTDEKGHTVMKFEKVDASALKGTKWKNGGMWVSPKIAEVVLNAVEEMGYEVIKKYE
jgi:hypothetical protein